jgi:hypothetical protein
MSTNREDDQGRSTEKQPSVPTPRGGGDISGKGVSPAEPDADETSEEKSAGTSTPERQ